MFYLKPELKQDPQKRWALSDRIFFGNGACHILAGVFISMSRSESFSAEWIKPNEGFRGSHIYVTDGIKIFDHRGVISRDTALMYHRKKWTAIFPGWDASIQAVDFDLLNTSDLNERKMLGPNQYLQNPIPRAMSFIEKFGFD